MQQVRVPADPFGLEPWQWLIDAIAEEIAAGAPHDPQAVLARVAARMQPAGLDLYLPMMFPEA